MKGPPALRPCLVQLIGALWCLSVDVCVHVHTYKLTRPCVVRNDAERILRLKYPCNVENPLMQNSEEGGRAHYRPKAEPRKQLVPPPTHKVLGLASYI